MIDRRELDRAFDERFAPEVKARLQAARVAVAGLGGLGSNIAVMLARSGVGHLKLVDFDRVDTTNLNRQAYGISHIGKYKTDAIREILAEINPYLDVETVCVRVTQENAVALFRGWPLVCEAFDRPENKALLVRSLLADAPGTLIVSGNGMAGYGDANDIRTLHPMRRLYLCGDQKTGAEPGMGLLAPRVAVCAGHEANKILQLILEQENSTCRTH